MTDINQEALGAVKALRETVEKYGADSAQFKSMVDTTTQALEKQEKANQEFTSKLAEEQKSALELKERIDGLELELSRKGTTQTGANHKETEEYKAMQAYVQKGVEQLSIEQKNTLRTDIGTQGGYLTMPELDSMIIKKITEISPMRQYARVRTVGSKTLSIPTRTAIPVATYEGEAAAGGESNSFYGQETLTAYRMTVTVPYTYDQLIDSQFDIESEIMSDVAEAFAFTEGAKFVNGSGAKQPEGFLANADVAANFRLSSTSGVITGDDVLLLSGDLKVGYNPMYAMNRQTLAFLRTLKGSTNDHYLWQVGLGPTQPNTLAGAPYAIMQDMPSIAANSLSLVYADFARGYTIIDRTGLMVIRDELTRKKNNIIELTFHRYNHGQVVLSEAFKVLKTKP
jgi:HK97 family phage major capsid protein